MGDDLSESPVVEYEDDYEALDGPDEPARKSNNIIEQLRSLIQKLNKLQVDEKRSPFMQRQNFMERKRSPFMQRQSFMGQKRSPFMQRQSFMEQKRSPFMQRQSFMDHSAPEPYAD